MVCDSSSGKISDLGVEDCSLESSSATIPPHDVDRPPPFASVTSKSPFIEFAFASALSRDFCNRESRTRLLSGVARHSAPSRVLGSRPWLGSVGKMRALVVDPIVGGSD